MPIYSLLTDLWRSLLQSPSGTIPRESTCLTFGARSPLDRGRDAALGSVKECSLTCRTGARPARCTFQEYPPPSLLELQLWAGGGIARERKPHIEGEASTPRERQSPVRGRSGIEDCSDLDLLMLISLCWSTDDSLERGSEADEFDGRRLCVWSAEQTKMRAIQPGHFLFP